MSSQLSRSSLLYASSTQFLSPHSEQQFAWPTPAFFKAEGARYLSSPWLVTSAIPSCLPRHLPVQSRPCLLANKRNLQVQESGPANIIALVAVYYLAAFFGVHSADVIRSSSSQDGWKAGILAFGHHHSERSGDPRCCGAFR